MAAEHEKSLPTLPSLAGAPWLGEAPTRGVLAALRAAGFEGRIVGGAVRNTLMGLAVSDLDIATPAVPDAVVAACAKAGLATVPTGLDHGTVTVITNGVPIEVTTLRRDVATDGRRATVAFTADWAEDARRRDFTMNALYCDADGRLYDFVGGYPDLVARRVRFIGDADERIAEDYLRILRFFRFHAAYASGAPDAAGLAACARGVGGMGRLSAERIRAEMVKLLVAPGVLAAIEAMEGIGLLTVVVGTAPRPGLLARVVGAEVAAGGAPDAMLRLAALAVASADDIPRIARRLRLSSEERKALIVIDEAAFAELGDVDAHAARTIVYRKGRDTSRRLALALAAVLPERTREAKLLREVAADWAVPRMPVSGADLVARGVTPGPAVGRLLTDLESWWLDRDFPSRDVMLEQLEARLALDEAE